jgi:putative phosphoesterase
VNARTTSSFGVANRTRPVRVGVISDTHGLLRPAALTALRGSDLVIHAGDVGNADVITRLRALAPTVVVRGNNDKGAWAARLPDTARIDVGGIRLLVLHELTRLRLDPVAAGIGVVVSGHSHRPSIVRREGILYVNPGSAGPRRFTLPVSVARLSISRGRIRSKLVELET